jgi:hypothetical protein
MSVTGERCVAGVACARRPGSAQSVAGLSSKEDARLQTLRPRTTVEASAEEGRGAERPARIPRSDCARARLVEGRARCTARVATRRRRRQDEVPTSMLIAEVIGAAVVRMWREAPAGTSRGGGSACEPSAAGKRRARPTRHAGTRRAATAARHRGGRCAEAALASSRRGNGG